MSAKTVSIANGDEKSLVMTFYPEVGGSIGSLTLTRDGKTIDILRPYDPSLPLHEFNMASFPMVPMCGRTDHGQFVFEGKTYHVGPNSEGEPHPNHGNGREQAWTVMEHKSDEITMKLVSKSNENMPHDYTAQQKVLMDGDNICIDMTVTNDGDKAMPFGLGHHIYLNNPGYSGLFGFEADYVWRTEGMIPQDKIDLPPEFDFSKPKLIKESEQKKAYGSNGTAFMDHCFGGYKGRTVLQRPDDNVTVIMETKAHHFIAYIPSDNGFICCFSPSNMPDGFNRFAKGEENTGTKVLQPGETMHYRTTLEIS